MIVGILLGFGAACCQSLSYLASGTFVRRFQSSTVVLLALSHIIMGGFSAVILALSWPETMPSFRLYARPLVLGVVSYLIGQLGLFLALRRADASRVSPLLGLKIVLLALISTACLGHSYSAAQWAAVLISVLAAALLNESGGRIPLSSLLWICMACTWYSISDINIKAQVSHFTYLGLLRGCLVSASMSYLLCGIAGLAVLGCIRRPSREMWVYALPFALAWFSAMLFLFACFSLVGVVFGNIIQSTRGLISILIGVAIAGAGYVHLEQRVSPRVFVKRVIAALLMIAAIALFSLSKTS